MSSASDVAKSLENQKKQEKDDEYKPSMGYKPASGYDWNPFLKYPPNLYCMCGSGIKFKKCCSRKISRVIEISKVASMTEYMKKTIDYITELKSRGIAFKMEEKK